MGVEIEHKFLVRGEPWHGHAGVSMIQGYLAREDDVAVRVRLAGDRAWLTVKGPSEGALRPEFEYAIPVADARGLLALCGPRVLSKTRYEVPYGGHVWEIDVFSGSNEGLVVAEVELDALSESFDRPSWLATDVTTDRRYANASLVDAPHTSWARS